MKIIFPTPAENDFPCHAENDSKKWTVTARDEIFASLCFVWPDIFAQFHIHCFFQRGGVEFNTVNITQSFGLYFPIHPFPHDNINEYYPTGLYFTIRCREFTKL